MNVKTAAITDRLLRAIRSTGEKTKGYKSEATVTRVDGDTVWAHLPGGVAETPFAKTIDCAVGDRIYVDIENGRGRINGNYSAPPTDDAEAIAAAAVAGVAQVHAAAAVESASIAEQAADAALIVARAAAINATKSSNISTAIPQHFFYNANGAFVTSDDVSVDFFTGDGSITSFTLSTTPHEILAVYVDGVASTAWTISTKTVAFAIAPDDNTGIAVIYDREPLEDYSQITSTGLNVYVGGYKVASFRDISVIGNEALAHQVQSSTSTEFYDESGVVVGEFGESGLTTTDAYVQELFLGSSFGLWVNSSGELVIGGI